MAKRNRKSPQSETQTVLAAAASIEVTEAPATPETMQVIEDGQVVYESTKFTLDETPPAPPADLPETPACTSAERPRGAVLRAFRNSAPRRAAKLVAKCSAVLQRAFAAAKVEGIELGLPADLPGALDSAATVIRTISPEAFEVARKAATTKGTSTRTHKDAPAPLVAGETAMVKNACRSHYSDMVDAIEELDALKIVKLTERATKAWGRDGIEHRAIVQAACGARFQVKLSDLIRV